MRTDSLLCLFTILLVNASQASIWEELGSVWDELAFRFNIRPWDGMFLNHLDNILFNRSTEARFSELAKVHKYRVINSELPFLREPEEQLVAGPIFGGKLFRFDELSPEQVEVQEKRREYDRNLDGLYDRIMPLMQKRNSDSIDAFKALISTEEGRIPRPLRFRIKKSIYSSMDYYLRRHPEGSKNLHISQIMPTVDMLDVIKNLVTHMDIRDHFIMVHWLRNLMGKLHIYGGEEFQSRQKQTRYEQARQSIFTALPNLNF